ncbi:MAG TPA: SDR family NAD(P)-dependent oxidoreductase [Acidimicrobiales bacterium]|nr:SDR family NAD(P)-dependent oxidoreductase [Acidimicrobiales bacterium]
MRDLSGRVAVVTGGNGGIGLSLARAVAEAGASVAIWARNEQKSAAAVDELAAGGLRAMAVRCDVSVEDDVVAAMARTLEELGKVDVLIANAGFNRKTPFLDMTLAEWREVMGTNLDGAFLCTREAARHMVARGDGGALVIVSSIVARYGAPTMQHYAATKAGLVSLARSIAVELARYRIRCNGLLPGWTETELADEWLEDPKFVDAVTRRTPARRWGVPVDCAPAAVYLADPTLTFHTGDVLTVDGGYSVA